MQRISEWTDPAQVQVGRHPRGPVDRRARQSGQGYLLCSTTTRRGSVKAVQRADVLLREISAWPMMSPSSTQSLECRP